MNRPILAACAVMVALVAGCQTPTGTTSASVGATSGPLPVGIPSAPMPAPGTCTIRHHGGQDLPDPTCTPGATNPAVTQDTIATTICRTGWTATIRPPVAATNRWKHESDASYGMPATEVGEYDHLVSLELGGAPLDPRNLWVEPGKLPNSKDKVENALHRAVCTHRVALAAAQTAIARDWTTAESTLAVGP